MKHFHLLKRLALACGLAATAALVSSCSSTIQAPVERAEQLRAGTNVTMFSYNDASSPKSRFCTPAGPMPDNVRRALYTWLRHSTVKSFNYAYPQYYIAMTAPDGKQRIWGICTDGKANLVGILIPRDGVAAWDLPFVGSYKMYVCENKQRQDLSEAIMTYLYEVGYDSYRIESRKASGIVDAKYLVSKPKTRTEIAAERAAKEAQRAAMIAAGQKPAETAEDDDDETSGDEESTDEKETSGDEESSEDEESTDEEESSEDEESTDEESSEDEEASEDEDASEDEESDFE